MLFAVWFLAYPDFILTLSACTLKSSSITYVCVKRSSITYWFCIHEEWPSLKLKKPKPYYYFDQFAKNKTRLYHLGLVSVFNLSGVVMLSRIQKLNNFTVAKNILTLQYKTDFTVNSSHNFASDIFDSVRLVWIRILVFDSKFRLEFYLFGWSIILNIFTFLRFYWNIIWWRSCQTFSHFCIYILIDFFENNNIQK